jgi:hypothetical protein
MVGCFAAGVRLKIAGRASLVIPPGSTGLLIISPSVPLVMRTRQNNAKDSLRASSESYRPLVQRYLSLVGGHDGNMFPLPVSLILHSFISQAHTEQHARNETK